MHSENIFRQDSDQKNQTNDASDLFAALESLRQDLSALDLAQINDESCLKKWEDRINALAARIMVHAAQEYDLEIMGFAESSNLQKSSLTTYPTTRNRENIMEGATIPDKRLYPTLMDRIASLWKQAAS